MNDTEKRINKMLKKSEVILNAGNQTNEEWFTSLPTEEKAKFMCNIYEMGKNGKDYFMRLDKCVKWLKQPHTSKE